MIISELFRLLQFVLILAAQVLVFNHIHFMDHATPLVYVGFLLGFPLNYSRSGILLWGFLMGLLVDIFSNTPGVAAASTTLVALIQPVLLRHMTPKDAVEDMVPNFHTLGKSNYFWFFFIVILIHHIAAFLLESFTYFHLADVAIDCGSSILLTTFIVWGTEHLLNRKS